MTHSLHREGTRENLSNDFTIYCLPAVGINDKGSGNKRWRFLEIALYYEDEKAAETDGAEIMKRMQSYIIGTWQPNMDNTPFTDLYLPGDPEIYKYSDGVVLKVPCQLIPEERRGVSFHMGGIGLSAVRDLLFLAPDPSVYVAE